MTKNAILSAVSTDLEGKNAWKECFKVENVLLPTGYFFGASATTGDLSDNHDIISIKMFELDLLEAVSTFTPVVSQSRRSDRGVVLDSEPRLLLYCKPMTGQYPY